MTLDWRLYFPSEGSSAVKNPSSSARYEPTNFGFCGKHTTTRPPRVLYGYVYNYEVIWKIGY
jgi:hypothetical protein